MPTQQSPCAPELLELCLQDGLTAAELGRLEAHLNQCETCRKELENLAAAPHTWSLAASLLKELPTGSAGVGQTGDIQSRQPLEKSVHATDFVVDVLLPARTPNAIGRLDDIEIHEVIGSGGNGIVLKGWQTELQRLVAVKVLRPDLCYNADARVRFVREARAAAAVVHPHVMPIYSVHAEGRCPYFVMPLLSCESLQDRLDRVGCLPLVEVLQIGIQVSQALAAAHSRGLVHRDIKPANILIEKSGLHVVLADFGLARAVDDASLTQDGFVAGTPRYMSPEQAYGERVDERSDLFSLGSVLYALWTGRPPFSAETAVGVLRRLTDSQPRAMSSLRPETPVWWEDLVMWLHQKVPEDRLGPAEHVSQLLENCLRHTLQPALHPIPAELLMEVDAIAHIDGDDDTSQGDHIRLFLIWGVVGMVISALAITTTAGMAIVAMSWLPDRSAGPPPPPVVVISEPATEPVTKAPAEPSIEFPAHLYATEPTPFPSIQVAEVDDQKKAAAETKYGSAEEAYRVGAAFYSLKEYVKTKEPFEAALALAPDDAYRLKVYRALLQAYTQESKWQPKAEALEFIIAKSEQEAERSLARRELMGFIRERGKTSEAVKRYEERLKLDSKDEATMYILIEIYSRLKDDPRRAAALLEQWETLKKANGQEMKVSEAAQLAQEYVKQKKFQEGAELYEKTALRDAKLAAWHYKDAAAAWLKAGDKTRAVAAAKASAECAPETRSELLEHYWHRGLADVFFDTGEYALAIPHYEQAIAKTQIDGYLKDCRARLELARMRVTQ